MRRMRTWDVVRVTRVIRIDEDVVLKPGDLGEVIEVCPGQDCDPRAVVYIRMLRYVPGLFDNCLVLIEGETEEWRAGVEVLQPVPVWRRPLVVRVAMAAALLIAALIGDAVDATAQLEPLLHIWRDGPQ